MRKIRCARKASKPRRPPGRDRAGRPPGGDNGLCFETLAQGGRHSFLNETARTQNNHALAFIAGARAAQAARCPNN